MRDQVEKDARSDTEDEDGEENESESELAASNGLAAGDHVTKHTAEGHSQQHLCLLITADIFDNYF